MDARAGLESEGRRPAGVPGARDRTETVAIIVLCLLTVAHAAAAVLLCVQVVRAAVG